MMWRAMCARPYTPKAAAAIVRRCAGDAANSIATTPKEKGSKTPTKALKSESSAPVPARRRWALLRILPHAADQRGARASTNSAIAWALEVLGGNFSGDYAMGGPDEAAAVLAAAMSARAAAGPEEAEEEAGGDAAVAIRAAAAAPLCPGVLTAAAALVTGAANPAAAGTLKVGPGRYCPPRRPKHGLP